MEQAIYLLFILMLSIFVGFEIIAKVPSTLHTPLMSGSNAISGITLLGAITLSGLDINPNFASILGMVSVILATINIVGGYLITDKMLKMFKKKGASK